MKKDIFKVLLSALILASLGFAPLSYGVGGKLSPGGGGVLTPPTVIKSGTAVVPALTGDTFGDFSNLWNGYFSTIYATSTSINGLNEKVSTGSFADATTTFFAVNPFFGIGTSTVDLAIIDGINGTTSIAFMVGTTTVTSLGPTTTPSASLINVASVSTSTSFYLVNNTFGSGKESASAGTESLERIVVGPAEYVTGLGTSTSQTYTTGLQGILNTNNTLSGTYKIRFNR